MQSKRSSHFRVWAMAGAAVAVIGGPAWAQDARRSFNIPSQDLGGALEAFGRQSGQDIVFDAGLARGRRAPALIGTYRIDEALARLLSGSDLRARRVNATSFMVELLGPQAEAAAGSAEPAVVEEVVVTGSNIRGASPTSPLHTVTRRDIDQSGYGHVGDLIRSLPENFAGGSNPGNIAAGNSNPNTSNASTVNLRGLGDGATLVLLNGRRLAANVNGQSADISGIPLEALERVEIVADGSSATYGSDAVAGVANFILRKDYDGATVSARLGSSTQGGGFEQTYTALAGVARADWRALFNVEYSKTDAILASDRDFTAQAPPNLTLSRPQEQTSIFVSAARALTSKVSVDVDALWSNREVSYLSQTRRTGSATGLDTGTTSSLLNAGAKLDLSKDWRLRLNATQSYSRTNSVTKTTTLGHTRYRNWVRAAEATVEGPILQGPGGDVRIALGGGWRDETFKRDSRTSTAIVRGEHESRYVFGELFAPLVAPSPTRLGLQALELSLSGRYEDYSDYGDTTTPKLGLRYAPLDGLSLRGTWGKSFKTPSFTQYASARNVSFGLASSLGVAGGGTYILAQGGNNALRPERSTSWTIGGDYTPPDLPTLTLGLTYFNIDYTDRVVLPISPISAALSNPAFAPFVIRNPSVAEQTALINDAIANGGTVINSTGSPYNPATVVAVVMNRQTNATAQTAEGLDASYRQTFALSGGAIEAFANATVIRLRQRTLPGLPVATLSSKIYNVPRLRARTGASWTWESFTATGIVNYTASAVDNGVTPYRRIASQTTIDATGAYRRLDGALAGSSLTLSVLNVLDRKPPYAASPAISFNDGVNFDSTNASPIGRFVSVTLRKAF